MLELVDILLTECKVKNIKCKRVSEEQEKISRTKVRSLSEETLLTAGKNIDNPL